MKTKNISARRNWVLSGALLATFAAMPPGIRPASAAAEPATQPSATPLISLSPPEMVSRVEVALQSLDLNDDQKAKLQDILTDAKTRAAALQEKIKDASPRDRLIRVAPFLKGLSDQIRPLLSADQLKQLGEKLNIPRPGGRQGAGLLRFAQLKDALLKIELSPDQEKKITDVLDTAESQLRDAITAQRNGQDVSATIQQIRQDLRSGIGGILTPEQRSRLQELMNPATPSDSPATQPSPGDAPTSRPSETPAP